MTITANTNKIIILLLLFLMSSAAISDASQQNMVSTNPPSKTKDDSVNSIYKSFLYEKTVCQKFVMVIAKDKDFIENVENKLLDYRERESGERIFEMLAKSKSKKNEVVQYVLRNSSYFWIDLDSYGKPGMTYVKDSCIYCMQTDKRLKEIEALGPSEQSWKVREHYLNLELDGLLEFGMPWSEGPVNYNFEYLGAKVDTAKKLYSQQFKNSLKDWIQKVSMQLKKEMDTGESYYDNLIKEGKNKSYYLTSKEKGLRAVEGWIAELNKGLE